MIVVWPTGGLGNRLRVMSSFQVLARYAGRPFTVCWEPGAGWSDEHLGDLFDHELRTITRDEFERVSAGALELHNAVAIAGVGEERTRTWSPATNFRQVFDENTAVITYVGPQRCDQLLDPDERLAVLGDDFNDDYAADVRAWRPVRSIRKAVRRIASDFGQNTVGVHIRRGDAWLDRRPASPYRRSTDTAFIAAMDRELAADTRASFFLATDCAETEARFRERYGPAVLTNGQKSWVPSLPGQPKDNQRDAVIDLFALARTRRILGSYYSSFSKVAALLGDITRTDVVEDVDA